MAVLEPEPQVAPARLVVRLRAENASALDDALRGLVASAHAAGVTAVTVLPQPAAAGIPRQREIALPDGVGGIATFVGSAESLREFVGSNARALPDDALLVLLDADDVHELDRAGADR
jgi:hypothetical protein